MVFKSRPSLEGRRVHGPAPVRQHVDLVRGRKVKDPHLFDVIDSVIHFGVGLLGEA